MEVEEEKPMSKREKIFIGFIGVFLFITESNFASPINIDSNDLAALKSSKDSPCSLIHLWATWCPNCIEELPGFIKTFAEGSKVETHLIDVSTEFQQKSFSIRWITQLNPSQKTYVKSDKDDHGFQKALGTSWKGELPYSVLFIKSPATGHKPYYEYLGAGRAEEIKRDIQRFCK